MPVPSRQRSLAARSRHAASRSPSTVRRTLVVLAAAVVALLGVATTFIVTLTQQFGNDVTRVPDAFRGLDAASRPPAAQGETFLLVGTDTRSDVPTTGTGAQAPANGRSDVLMIAQLAADGKSAAVVSIPRDSWVDIPGHGKDKINAAYALGGPSLLIKTAENLTSLRINHFAIVDFAGFRSIVDSIGGIDVGISEATSNDGVDFHQGINHLDGTQALAYVRQRYGLVGGDLDRSQRQQNALRAVLDKVSSTGTLDDPIGLYRLLDAATGFVSVDDTLTNDGLRTVTQQLRGLPPGSVSFLRAPIAGLGRERAESVAYLDRAEAANLWSALRTGTVGVYAEQHAADALGPVTR